MPCSLGCSPQDRHPRERQKTQKYLHCEQQRVERARRLLESATGVSPLMPEGGMVVDQPPQAPSGSWIHFFEAIGCDKVHSPFPFPCLSSQLPHKSPAAPSSAPSRLATTHSPHAACHSVAPPTPSPIPRAPLLQPPGRRRSATKRRTPGLITSRGKCRALRREGTWKGRGRGVGRREGSLRTSCGGRVSGVGGGARVTDLGDVGWNAWRETRPLTRGSGYAEA